MIYVFDEIRAKPGQLRALEKLLRERYVPGARRRGMELVDLCITPVLELPANGSHLVALWRLADVAAWWRMRLAAAADPDVAACWKAIDGLAESRSRHFLAPIGNKEGGA